MLASRDTIFWSRGLSRTNAERWTLSDSDNFSWFKNWPSPNFGCFILFTVEGYSQSYWIALRWSWRTTGTSPSPSILCWLWENFSFYCPPSFLPSLLSGFWWPIFSVGEVELLWSCKALFDASLLFFSPLRTQIYEDGSSSITVKGFVCLWLCKFGF